MVDLPVKKHSTVLDASAEKLVAHILFDGHWDDGTCYPHGQSGAWELISNLEELNVTSD